MAEDSIDTLSVYIQGIDALSSVVRVANNEADFEKTTIKQLKDKIVSLRPELTADSLHLLFVTRKLEEKNEGGEEATLGHYKIRGKSTVHIGVRMPPGMAAMSSTRKDTSGDVPRDEIPRPPDPTDKMHDLSDLSLTFTTEQPDCIDPFSDPNGPPRVVMSCGDAVDPNSLTEYCRSLVDAGRFEFFCPAIFDSKNNKGCGRIWDYTEVRQKALLSDSECHWFESMLALRAVQEYYDTKRCPGCKTHRERADPGSLRVHCTVCSKKKGYEYDFCWQCMNEWTDPTSLEHCGRPVCESPGVVLLRNAPTMTYNGITVPNLRACPNCGQLVEHDGTGCKFATCPRCRKDLCFLCLHFKEDCLKMAPDSWQKECGNPVAPRQTVLPIWRR